ncbi:MAG: thiamine phosphate synthase [Armatimonadetes bacterium]|nr:thiamine phosphate synthase [Armatimonadota bacterium]
MREFPVPHGIYVVTDVLLPPGRTHVAIARAAVAGGARILQLRDKEAPDEALREPAQEIRRLTRAAGVLFVINDRLELARAVGADGVHLGQSDLPARRARESWPEGILGITVGEADDARRAEADGADYLGLGPIFATQTKGDAGPAVGLAAIPRVRAASRLPIVAIGGIHLGNVAQIAAAGAAWAAVVSAVVCAPDMEAATRALAAAFAAGERGAGTAARA